MLADLTQDERDFAASGQGSSQIAAARHQFEQGEARKGAHAQRWSEAMQADTIRKLAACHRWEETQNA